MAKQGNGGKRNFLRINRDGVFYLPTTGDRMGQPNIVEVELEDGSKVYHELFRGGTEDGRITYLNIVEKNFKTGKVEHLVLSITGEDETDQISLPLYDRKDNLTDYVKSVVAWLPNVDYSKIYSIKPSTKKNPRGYVYRTLFLNDVAEDKAVEREYTMGKNGNVPPFVEKEAAGGKKKYDFTDQDKFFFEKLQEQIARFQQESDYEPNRPQAPVTSAPATHAAPAPSPTVDDDLPF